MGYYVHVDFFAYDKTKRNKITCSGVSEAIVLKIIDIASDSDVDIKIYREVEDELQDN